MLNLIYKLILDDAIIPIFDISWDQYVDICLDEAIRQLDAKLESPCLGGSNV
jgi:hypothetical protein